MPSLVHAASPRESSSTVVFVRGGQTETLKAAAEEQIRILAYQKWEAAGKPESDGVRFWLEAEREFLQGE